MDANLLVGMRKKVNDAVEAHVVKTRGEMGAGIMQAEKTSTALIGKALSPSWHGESLYGRLGPA